MSTTDGYGQGIGLWSMTDAPSIPDAISLFAAGVLPRLRMTFASASARGATLIGSSAPVPGMMTWLTDVGRLDVYDGSAWVAMSVGTSSWTTISLASGFTQNGNSNGNLQYRRLNISGEDSLQLRGAVNRTSYPASPPSSYAVNATALPTSLRPSTLRTVVVPCSDISSERITLKLDVQTDGYLVIFGIGTDVKPPWIGFNGVTVSL
ncbi:hypothetical protein ACFYNA_15110 [Streptomyces sp. NPDC006640]|jgi:hypothetical protein|uniref:hypothetical protein n=1 Tax=Streptomyces sp. NPDC006640 TaxID=3364754 RepID=UPI0036C170A1